MQVLIADFFLVLFALAWLGVGVVTVSLAQSDTQAAYTMQLVSSKQSQHGYVKQAHGLAWTWMVHCSISKLCCGVCMSVCVCVCLHATSMASSYTTALLRGLLCVPIYVCVSAGQCQRWFQSAPRRVVSPVAHPVAECDRPAYGGRTGVRGTRLVGRATEEGTMMHAESAWSV